MQEEKNKIEAVLFTTGRFLELEEIGKLCGVGSIGYIKTVLGELQKEYAGRSTALEIINDKDRWKLNIRKDYLHLTEKLLSDAELDMPTQATLALIAYKQPAIQSDVIRTRGNKAYDHVKKLKEEGFLIAEKFGRTRILKLTTKFYDYFDVVEDELKGKLIGIPEDNEEELSKSDSQQNL
ncbi:SMC-Scp complex subunit ScpB [archaeon]|nr:SMC-Scp complex subunit ScpB [archaeon]